MIKAASLAAALLAAAPASAQPEATGAPTGLEIVAEIDLLSDYRFRGVSRSDEDPAVQAGIQLFHASGLYAGVRATSLAGVDSFRLQDQGGAQLDLYAGYGADLGGGFHLDTGLIYYAFAGAAGDADHVEPYASLSYLIGPVQLTGGAKYAPSQAGTRREDMLYLYGQLDVAVPFRPWAFKLEAGRQDWGAFGSYWAWSAGGRYHVRIEGMPDAEVGLTYVDSDLPSGPGRDGALVASLNFRF